jgi:uroporphyrinogen decarboxylase
MEEWTSRKRVLVAIEHKEPDRIPISFGGTLSTGILECPPDGKTYTKLCKHMGIKDYEEPNIGFLSNYVSNIDERMLKEFGSDFRRVDPNPPEAKVESDGTKTILGIYCGMRVKKMGYYDDIFEFPFRDCKSKKDIQQYPFWPTPDDFNKIAKGKEKEAKNLRENTNYAIVADAILWYPFLAYPLLAGYEKWFMDMKSNPKLYFSFADKLFEVGLGIVEKFIGAVGDYIDMVATYDDMGTQEGLFCSHKDYVKFIKPYEKEMIKYIKKYTNAKIYRHSCGSIYEVIPDFIEMGVDVLNPVQPLAKNMEPWRLKQEFGKHLTFCGGIDTQRLLPYGTLEEVKKGVKKTIEIYAPDGGYILGPSHNIEPDTSPENIVAMYEAAQEYGRYSIS